MRFIAADFGAGSGRVIVGTWFAASKTIGLEEIHRFGNEQKMMDGHLRWDFEALFNELKTGLKKAFAKYGDEIKSIGIDTWGVDYGLLNKEGRLIANPICYRDDRTKGMMDAAFQKLPKEEFFQHAANQFMEINTAFQLMSETDLQRAERLLFMPDLFNYFLTGKCYNEFTIASTSQLLNTKTHQWDDVIFEKLNLPKRLMQEIIYPGTVIGELTAELAAEVGGNAKVVAIGSHDTASAVASIKDDGSDWAFISSGTWSLMGTPSKEPIISKEALESDFTNEGMTDGRIRFLKNITGLWLIQQLVKEWEQEGYRCNYSELVKEAELSSLDSSFDVDDARFMNPEKMSEAIVSYLKEENQELPITKGDFMRCVCISLAKKYAEVKTQMERCTNKKINKIYIVGGGSKNQLLNRLAAEYTGCEVIRGEVEATAMGNVLVQLKSENLKN
ncbi:MAG: rhamnulokinase [Lentimicrobiaceae bacterium]|nr:rhamnulokinase [Lentimicrobiaceae bacterium]